jgi:hypothetical protein
MFWLQMSSLSSSVSWLFLDFQSLQSEGESSIEYCDCMSWMKYKFWCFFDIFRECPADLKEGISSLIFASPRCSEIPELVALRKIFEKKYGKDFVSAATDLRPNSGVNRMVSTLSCCYRSHFIWKFVLYLSFYKLKFNWSLLVNCCVGITIFFHRLAYMWWHRTTGSFILFLRFTFFGTSQIDIKENLN